MNRKLKLIWDFRGPASKKTAEHHCMHLKEFATLEQLHYYEVNYTPISDMHCIAYITVDEADMKTYRDALKPHRGTLAE